MAAPAALQRLARRALLTRLKADATLTALVPAASIAPQGEPTWPFVLVESPRTLRLRMACVRGARLSFDVHAFAGPRLDAGAVAETGYDHTSRIAAAIEGALADNRITLEDGSVCKIEFSDAQMLRDGEPDAWHWFSQINCRVLAPAV
jgi:hypothetical protein